MAKRLVFLSHSSRSPAAVAFTKLVAASLEEDYELFLDWRTIEPGQAWRDRIAYSLARCDAAVLLLNPDALKSKWVRYEVTVLLNRKVAGDKNLYLFPVHLDGVTAPKVDRAFTPARLSDVQAQSYALSVRGTPKRAAPRIASTVRMTINPSRTPVEMRAAYLETLVTRVDPELTRRAIEALKMRPWPVSEDVLAVAIDVKRLLYALCSTDLQRAQLAVLFLSRGTTKRDDAYKILDITAMSFVDDESAIIIAQKATPTPTLAIADLSTTAVGIGATSEIIARLCAKAAALLTKYSLYFYTVATVLDRPASESKDVIVHTLKSKIEKALLDARGDSGEGPDARNRALRFVKRQRDLGIPVFVILSADGLDSDVLVELASEFPGVVYLLLTEHAPKHTDWMTATGIAIAPHYTLSSDGPSFTSPAKFEADLCSVYNDTKFLIDDFTSK